MAGVQVIKAAALFIFSIQLAPQGFRQKASHTAVCDVDQRESEVETLSDKQPARAKLDNKFEDPLEASVTHLVGDALTSALADFIEPEAKVQTNSSARHSLTSPVAFPHLVLRDGETHHVFLSNEAEMFFEESSLLSDPINSDTIEAIRDLEGWTLDTTMIISIGSSSTQLYVKGKQSAYVNRGNIKNDELPGEATRTVIAYVKEAGYSTGNILLVNGIGYIAMDSKPVFRIGERYKAKLKAYWDDGEGGKIFGKYSVMDFSAWGSEIADSLPTANVWVHNRRGPSRGTYYTPQLEMSWARGLFIEPTFRQFLSQFNAIVDFGGGSYKVFVPNQAERVYTSPKEFTSNTRIFKDGDEMDCAQLYEVLLEVSQVARGSGTDVSGRDEPHIQGNILIGQTGSARDAFLSARLKGKSDDEIQRLEHLYKEEADLKPGMALSPEDTAELDALKAKWYSGLVCDYFREMGVPANASASWKPMKHLLKPWRIVQHLVYSGRMMQSAFEVFNQDESAYD